MSLEKNRKKTQKMVITALFAAIIVALQFIPIPTFGAVALNLSLVPLVLGAVLYGPLLGATLGAVMGIAVVFQILLRPDLAGALAIGMYTLNPFLTIVLCIVKTAAAGAVSGLVAKCLTKYNRTLAVVLASAVCPVVNTGIFLAGLCGLFYGVLEQVATELTAYSPVMFVLMIIVVLNFVPEFILNVVVSPVIVRVSEIVKKNNK